MLAAESRLVEHDLHAFADADFSNVKISKGSKSREAVRLAEKKDGWADAASPTKLDETIGNYMSKLSRFRVSEYVEKPTPDLHPQDAIVRVDYFSGTKPLGYLQLFKVPGEKSSQYLIQTEYGRWYAKVQTNSAEQVEQDLNGVLK